MLQTQPLTFNYYGSDCFNVIGIDPGTDTVGFCVMTYSPVEKRIVKTMATTLVGSKLITGDALVETHGERIRRVTNLRIAMLRLFMSYWPAYVGCEKPFFNFLRPGAFEPLLEGLFAVSGALQDYDPLQVLMTVDPSSAKKAVGANGAAKKEQIREAIARIAGELNFDSYLSGRELSSLDEHSNDAIAICRWTLRQVTQ